MSAGPRRASVIAALQPRIAVSGVRSSCATMVTKSSFARSARWACWTAVTTSPAIATRITAATAAARLRPRRNASRCRRSSAPGM